MLNSDQGVVEKYIIHALRQTFPKTRVSNVTVLSRCCHVVGNALNNYSIQIVICFGRIAVEANLRSYVMFGNLKCACCDW